MSLDLTSQQALNLWCDTLCKGVAEDGLNLTMRQMAIFMIVYLKPPPHTVRGLAKQLGVTKPVITRALDSLGQKGLVQRVRDREDKRNVLVQRTLKGAHFLIAFSDRIIEAGREQ